MNPIYFDSETTGLDPFKNRITLVQVLRDKKIILDNLKDPASIHKLKDLLESSLVVGHNLKFDLKFITQI